MLTLLQRQPWRVLGLAGALAKAHLAVHRVAAPTDLPDLRRLLAVRIHDAVLPPHLRGFALQILDGLMLRWADPLPGTPLLSRALIAVGRSLLTGRYARTYRRGTKPLRQLDSWLLVHAAARLSEGIQTEQTMLIGILDRARRKATR